MIFLIRGGQKTKCKVVMCLAIVERVALIFDAAEFG